MFSLALIAAIAVDPSLTRLRDEDARVAAIAWRMQTANAAICPQKANLSGLSLHALSQYPRALRSAASAQFGLGSLVAISAIVPESAAALAGLKVGDGIVAINGTAAPTVAVDAGYAPVAAVETMFDAALAQPPVILRVERDGTVRDISLTGAAGCPSRVQIIAGNSINAGADGNYVQINARMLDFVQSDDELATIIGHELAHNILRHKAARTPSKQAEYEADALGIWLVARAGYNVNAVLPFWTRFEARTNAGIFADGTHPSKKKRLAAITATLAQVAARQQRGERLDPPAQYTASQAGFPR